jgi:SAM-dependent methyltransferase
MDAATLAPPGLPPLLADHLALLCCPACGGDLRLADSGLECAAGGHAFGIDGGIPLLFVPDERDAAPGGVTERVRAFYEANPFPGYDGIESRWTLREKARAGHFARLLDEQVGPRATILEAGCGTGQLSNFLGMTWGRRVFATDLCLASLRLGRRFQEAQEIAGTGFLQMNLFRPAFRPGTFDLVISNGVLHHTGDPRRGLETLARLTRPGGWVIVGLYNAYGRLVTDLRRALFRRFGRGFHFFDRRLRDPALSAERKRIWFADQYQNPHETKHTIDEVLGWFAELGLEFVKSVPKPSPFDAFAADEKLFEAIPAGSRAGRIAAQLRLVLAGGQEGGFFLMIGRKGTAGAGSAGPAPP